MSKAHERVVEAQFGPRAKAYVESAVHSQGADLEAIGTLAHGAGLALDLGAGGGHVSYALARHARRVIASDLSSEMLAAVARFHRAGVQIVSGTDNFAGFTLQRELELYVKAGIPANELVVSLVEAGREDWSFGNGIAQYVPAG